MRQQSLSRKIILAYSLLVTLSAGLLTSSLYWQFRTVQRQEIRNRLLELLRLSTPQIDSDYLALTITADSMKEPFYKINQERLQNIQAAVPSIDHIYAVRQQPDGRLVFILDYASATRSSTPVGTPLQHQIPGLQAGIAMLKQPLVAPDLLRNREGVPVLYGYAPITNQFGRTSGVLVVELNASSVIQSELQAGALASGVFGMVLLLTLVVIWWLSQSLVIQPILRLNQASKQIASGQWDQFLSSDRGDELGDLAASFNQMATQLRESFATLEERVRDRTDQLQLALAAAKMGNWEWDMITNRQYWSSENCGLWGFLIDPSGRVLDQAGVEISPFPTFELILKRVHPDDRDRLLQTIQQTAAQHQLYEIEHRIRWDDGSIHWRYSRGAYSFNEQGQPIKLVGISMDITDRKQIEQEIHRSRDLFEATFQESADAIFLVDPVSLLILDCNQRAIELFEADHKQNLVNIQGSTLHASSFSEVELKTLRENFAKKLFWSQEIVYRTLNDRCFWGNFASKRIQVAERQMNLVRVTDISDRKQAEFLLQRQAEANQLLAIIAQTLNQSLHFDGELANCLEQIRQFLQCDRVLVTHFEANLRSATKLEAVSRADLILQERSIQNPGFPPAWFEALRRGEVMVSHDVQAAALPLWQAEFLSQARVRAEVVAPILQADQLWGLLVAHQCDQPRVWQSLEMNLLKQLGLQIGTASQKNSLYSQLENQLAQKEVLLKEVHHRVKNNLQVISAVIWLQSEVASNPIVTAALADTRHRLQAMSLTHESFYQYKDLRQINFDDYIQRLANNLLAAYSTRPDQIKLILHLQPIRLALETAIPCGLLLNELITNAVKHGFPDQRCGEICISLAQLVPPEPVVSEAAKRPDSPQAMSHCVLTIQDNGIGLPETLNLKKLKSLGLKLVYDLALQLDGNLELDRTHGTLFRLTFSSNGSAAGTLNE